MLIRHLLWKEGGPSFGPATTFRTFFGITAWNADHSSRLWIAKYLTRRPRAINCIYNLIRQRHECQLRKIVKEDFVCLFPEMNSRRIQAHIILHIYISRSLPSALFLNRCYCTLVDLILPILSLPPRSRWHHQNRPSRPPTPSTRIQTAARGRTTFKSIWPIVLILY